MVNQYEMNQEGKRLAKNADMNPDDFKSAIGNIVNEISEGDLSGLEPPPEMPEETDVKDFSNVQIPSDDELF